MVMVVLYNKKTSQEKKLCKPTQQYNFYEVDKIIEIINELHAN